jgi:hypothetical protein
MNSRISIIVKAFGPGAGNFSERIRIFKNPSRLLRRPSVPWQGGVEPKERHLASHTNMSDFMRRGFKDR